MERASSKHLIYISAGLLAFVLSATGQTNYRDPQGRFSMRIPAGWNTVQMNSDAVQFSSVPAYVTLLVLPAGDLESTLRTIGDATGKQWKNFTEARRGDARFGGHAGKYVTYSGTNPMGADSYMQMLGVFDGSVVYLLMTSAPKMDFTRLKSAFDQIEESFTFSTAAPVSSAPPPAPAGTANLATGTPPPRPGTAPPPAPSAQGGSHVYRMKRVSIVDERGFERPMTALTLLIPIDWQFQGAVQYGQGTGCHANLVHLIFRASSPDGRFAMELLPGNTWQWTDDPNMRNMMMQSNQQMARFGARGCDILAPMTADAFVRRSVIPSARRGASVGGSEPLPDAVRQLEDEARVIQQVAARQGIRVDIRSDAGRVRVSYMLGGAPVEEWITAMTTSTSMPGPSFNIRTGRAGQVLYYSNAADHVFAMRAPQGQLDAQDKFFQLMMGTVQVDPQWQARVEQVMENLAAQDSQGAMARSAIATKAGQDMSKMIHDAYRNATNSREHSMAAWSQYMRGVQSFRNPNTGETVELSNTYDHAWTGPNNTYVLTDSANYNPNSNLQGNWTRLEAVKP